MRLHKPSLPKHYHNNFWAITLVITLEVAERITLQPHRLYPLRSGTLNLGLVLYYNSFITRL